MHSTGNKQSPVFEPLPKGPFSTIIADPPWDYSNKISGGGTSGFGPVHHSRGGTRGAANHYKTLSLSDLMSLPVNDVAAPEAHLYLWTTGTFMVEAHELAQAWGFAPKGVIPWIKVKRDASRYIEGAGGDLHAALSMGMGRYIRWCSEFVVFCVRGKLPTLRRDVVGALFAERGAHSEKPSELYDLIERLSPGPRLELFARAPQEGYASWGLELGERDPTRTGHRGSKAKSETLI